MNNAIYSAVTELQVFHATAKKVAKMYVEGRNFYSLSYRYDGKISIESKDYKDFSEKGSITFIPKNLSYSTEIVEDTSMIVAHFKLATDIDFSNPAITKEQDGLQSLFEKLLSSFHVDKPINFRCMSIFYQLLEKLKEQSERLANAKIPQKIASVKDYIIQNYKDPTVYVEWLANKFNVSTSYLRREFSKAYGVSPINYITNVRIKNAQNMLDSNALSITEIATQCGFSSLSYFIQVFNKTVGVSPRQYKQRTKITTK